MGEPRRTSESRALHLCRQNSAVMVNGQLLLLDCAAGVRSPSDVYVDQRGTIYWNGARSRYVEGRDVAMFPPCCNVVFPKTGSLAAARRYA